MPRKATRADWKSGEQLEFLFSQEAVFKRYQDQKTLDHFWPRVFKEWYDRWPIVPSLDLRREHGSAEAARVMIQKEKNAVRLF